MTFEFRATAHDDLSSDDLARLQRLFDTEYLADYGPWSADAPYGYSPAAVHVMAFRNGELAGHVGFQPRAIQVGDRDIVVAGTGGVLVSGDARGCGLGLRLMSRAQQAMREMPEIAFGYLGCRAEVVPFYEAAGWVRIRARERHLARLDPSKVAVSDDGPLLICAVARPVTDWPGGDIDLRGGAW